ncbi:hypothetical protein P3G55_25095, partial [Leptospira sp. 96542]|nr:hypothetical protein [Leptospira sp. 96542]
VSPIAGRGDGMQRDYWYSSQRHPDELAAPAAIGRYAAERALSRLKARKISTREVPVLFESPRGVQAGSDDPSCTLAPGAITPMEIT